MCEPSISTCRRGSARVSKIRDAGAAISIDADTTGWLTMVPPLISTSRNQDAGRNAPRGHSGVGVDHPTLGIQQFRQRHGTTSAQHRWGALRDDAPCRGEGATGPCGALDQARQAQQTPRREDPVRVGQQLPGVFGGQQIHDERRDDAISTGGGQGKREGTVDAHDAGPSRPPRQPCGCDPAHPRAHVEPDVAALWTPHVREQVTREPSRPATDLDHMASFGESTIGGQPRQRWRLEDPLGVLKPPDAVIDAGRLTRGQALGSRTGPAPVRPLTHRAPVELAEPMPARAARDGGDSAAAPTGAGQRGPSRV